VSAQDFAADKRDDHLQAYGVFKPVGHSIVSFAAADDLRAARAALREAGVADATMREYTPQQMERQAEQDIEHAGVLASIGQELNLVKAHRELAHQGFSFLMVPSPDDAAAALIAQVARRFNAERAQRFGRLVIEELVEPGAGTRQVAESPDRGLDAQTPSGLEGDTAARPAARRVLCAGPPHAVAPSG
jgi:hypothetical protein